MISSYIVTMGLLMCGIMGRFAKSEGPVNAYRQLTLQTHTRNMNTTQYRPSSRRLLGQIF